MRADRRRFLQSTAGVGMLAMARPSAPASGLKRSPLAAAWGGARLFELEKVSRAPVKIASVELLRTGNIHLIRTTSTDGATGISVCSDRILDFYPILQRRVAPYFVGKDARELESLVDGVYITRSNYKYAGLALWCCVGWVEFSLFDMLGKIAGKSVAELLGGVIRREIPVYLSSMRRDTTPEQEVAWLSKRLEETGGRAVKLKIGGRMSKNRDASPGRTDKLIPLARKTFGDSIDIHVDANGSYDSAHGIEVGKMLEAHNVYFFEEPCPFEELEETKRVADALKMPVAGGEQDASLPRFDWMIRNRAVDIVQPDLNYNGGFIRCARVARLAAAAGMAITPHSARMGVDPYYMLHFASATPNMGKYQEFRGHPHKPETWFSPVPQVKNGVVNVPTGPGLGITIDPEVLRKAKPLER